MTGHQQVDKPTRMDLQTFLMHKFRAWVPPPPELVKKTHSDLTLTWHRGIWTFVEDQLLYRIQRKEKMPPWVVVYSGGKSTKTITNLEPSFLHKFRLQVQLKATAVPHLVEKALQTYGSEDNVYIKFNEYEEVVSTEEKSVDNVKVKDDTKKRLKDDYDPEFPEKETGGGDAGGKRKHSLNKDNIEKDGDSRLEEKVVDVKHEISSAPKGKTLHPWLESQWSEELWASTNSDGTSVVCFCMAVKCGYLKQVSQMLEERPQLIGVVNTVNGLTPLATAVMKGNLATCRLLLLYGADVNQPSSASQTPLHLAIYTGRLAVAELLLEKGADMQAEDRNNLRVEHYAADSGRLDVVRFVFDRGGELEVEDNNGWTPLYRAVTQGATLEIIEELITRGADVKTMDRAGLTLPHVATLLKDECGDPRVSVIRLVDSRYPHEQAQRHFTRLTRKIHRMRTVFK